MPRAPIQPRGHCAEDGHRYEETGSRLYRTCGHCGLKPPRPADGWRVRTVHETFSTRDAEGNYVPPKPIAHYLERLTWRWWANGQRWHENATAYAGKSGIVPLPPMVTDMFTDEAEAKGLCDQLNGETL